jgi:exopolysaccharide production protein ExoQ
MAHDMVLGRTAGRETQSWIWDAGFLVLLLLAFVGMQPFAIRNPATDLEVGPYQATGGGDMLRQAFYLLLFASVVAAGFLRRGFAIVRAVPPMLLVLLGWCLMSALWATAPDIAMRRAGLAIVVAISAMLCVDAIGPTRALKLWWWVLAGVLVVNWLSVAILPQAVHLPGEQDPGLVGDWRGLYFHKNIAGAVSAVSAIVFLFSGLKSRRWYDFALSAGSVGFVVMTHSKSSLGLLAFAIAAGLTYRAAWRSGVDRMIVAIAALLVLALGIAALVVNADTVAHMLEDPAEFTGRGAIWQAEIAYIKDHPFLGSGFGTFADTGNLSPLHNYVGSAWVETVAHGHNGYLQMMVTIGGVGGLLAFIALLAIPFAQFWNGNARDLTGRAMLFALFVFFVLHNVMESDFLEGDAPAWVSFLLMLALLRARQEEGAA